MFELRRIGTLDIHERCIGLNDSMRNQAIHLFKVSMILLQVTGQGNLPQPDTDPVQDDQDTDGRRQECQTAPGSPCEGDWQKRKAMLLVLERHLAAHNRRFRPVIL